MKQRIITGIILFFFVVPFVIFGTYSFAIFILLLLGLGMYEFLHIKAQANETKTPIYVYIIAFVLGYLIIYDLPFFEKHFDFQTGLLSYYHINYIYIISAIAIYGLVLIDKRNKIKDSIYYLASTLYLSLALKGMLFLRSQGENINDGSILIGYIILVTCLTDIFAYFGGMTCYKLLGESKVHKLSPKISPKKTIEGSIIGTIVATSLGFLFAILVFKHTSLKVYPWYFYLILSFALAICGQIGDLLLSYNKRRYQIKDYSNILPGHGGVLDRIDSLLLNSLIAAILFCIL